MDSRVEGITTTTATPPIAIKAPDHPPLSIGAGLPPVPHKMVARIQRGEFVDMVELLPDRLGCSFGSTPEDKTTAKSKKQSVTNILEWIKCFGIYMAVIAKSQPDRIPDLLGYQSLIIEAHLEYGGDGWIGYDKRFRLNAAANSLTTWAQVDTTLWHLGFTGKAKTDRCKYCFSLTHPSDNCDWAPTTSTPIPRTPQRQRKICYIWNDIPGACPVPRCQFEHICIHCANNPWVQDKFHKGIYCQHRPSDRPLQRRRF